MSLSLRYMLQGTHHLQDLHLQRNPRGNITEANQNTQFPSLKQSLKPDLLQKENQHKHSLKKRDNNKSTSQNTQNENLQVIKSVREKHREKTMKVNPSPNPNPNSSQENQSQSYKKDPNSQ